MKETITSCGRGRRGSASSLAGIAVPAKHTARMLLGSGRSYGAWGYANDPRRFTAESIQRWEHPRFGSNQFGDEAIGDLCYYAPWGNLAMFHGRYWWSRGLIRLDAGPAPLLVRGEHPLPIEVMS